MGPCSRLGACDPLTLYLRGRAPLRAHLSISRAFAHTGPWFPCTLFLWGFTPLLSDVPSSWFQGLTGGAKGLPALYLP